MEVLIGIVLFGLAIYLLPYIIAGTLFLLSLAVGTIVAIAIIIKKIFGR